MRSFDDKEFSRSFALISLAYCNVFIHCFFERLLYFSINGPNANFKCFVTFRKTLLINDK